MEQITENQVKEFAKKLGESVKKLQATYPKPLSQRDIQAIENLIYEYVEYTCRCGGTRIDLAELIRIAIFKSREKFIEINVPGKERINNHVKKLDEIVKSSVFLSRIGTYVSDVEIDKNVPDITCWITTECLAACNHADQYLYSTSSKYPVTEEYRVKSYDQARKEYEEAQQKLKKQKEVVD